MFPSISQSANRGASRLLHQEAAATHIRSLSTFHIFLLPSSLHHIYPLKMCFFFFSCSAAAGQVYLNKRNISKRPQDVRRRRRRPRRGIILLPPSVFASEPPRAAEGERKTRANSKLYASGAETGLELGQKTYSPLPRQKNTVQPRPPFRFQTPSIAQLIHH